MIRPPFLKRGDKAGIVSPARSITFDEVHPGMRFFQRYGIEVVLGTCVFARNNQFAGTDEQRLADLQAMLDDPSIRAVICSRGGYGSVRIIDRLDFSGFMRHPKWIVGYSDITVLHSHIHRNFDTETLHATMPVNIRDDKADDSNQTMLNALFGRPLSYSYQAGALVRRGEASGILTGGNLSILCSLLGSPSDIDTTGKILFIEDVDEYLYHIDRMMMALRRSGKLAGLKGLVVGGMSRMNDNVIPFGRTAAEIIASAVADYHYPVAYDFPAGHLDTNLALFLGRQVRLSVGQHITLEFY